jgi:hypothetical protein
MGSNTLQQWMNDNAVEERDGEYWQRRKLDNGELMIICYGSPKEVFRCVILEIINISCMKPTHLK